MKAAKVRGKPMCKTIQYLQIVCNQIGNKWYFYVRMRVIATKTIKTHCNKYPTAKQSLLAWLQEAEVADWNNPNKLKAQYRNASVLNTRRVVFNIHGNDFRLIVDIEYRLKIVFVVWFGTHVQYDKIDAKTISYAKAN